MSPWSVVPLAASMMWFSCSTMGNVVGPPPPPGTITIHGVVRFANGSPADPATVRIERADRVLARGVTDSLGRYQLTVVSSPESASVRAQEDAAPGTIVGVIHYDQVGTVPDRDRVIDLTLEHLQPFTGSPPR